MGSTGSNTLGDYSPSSTTKCDDSLDVALEEVARLEFFVQSNRVPAKGTLVRLRSGKQSKRLVVEETSTGLAIGNMPTRLHYLVLCQERGYSFEGEVTLSRSGKVPVVEVHLDPV
jgi:hypothetical protein